MITPHILRNAIKGGESKRFDTYEEAKKFSNNIESNVDKNAYEAARKAYNQASSEAEAKVIQAMKKEIGGYVTMNRTINCLIWYTEKLMKMVTLQDSMRSTIVCWIMMI